MTIFEQTGISSFITMVVENTNLDVYYKETEGSRGDCQYSEPIPSGKQAVAVTLNNQNIDIMYLLSDDVLLQIDNELNK